MRPLIAILLLIAQFFLLACTQSGGAEETSGADVLNDISNGSNIDRGMVVTANPHATDAGLAVLAAGGSAVDAAVAIEAVLSLVEPQSSGLGGGGFMLHFDAQTKKITVYDGRETAPTAANPEMFLKKDGMPLSFFDAKNSGLSIGVPGMVSLLSLAHKDYGTLSWESLFSQAIQLAENGFDVSPRLNGFLKRFQEYIPSNESDGPIDTYTYFYDEDDSPRARLVNTAYANTLRLIGADANAFYRGDIAKEILAAVGASPRSGSMRLEDITEYRARREEPLCVDYEGLSVCGPPPPSSWVAVGMAMGMLEKAPRFPYSESAPNDWVILAEALRLAYADRDQYIADTDHISAPLSGMLHEKYLAKRAALIDPQQSAAKVSHGDPWSFEPKDASYFGDDTTDDRAGTTHFAVVDAQGNAVAMTASVESVFGSTRMAGGMLLNNQLTDFARSPRDENGLLVANSAAPGKRPRSSMSPTIVLNEKGEFLMSTGSPGGNSIISYTLKTLVGVLDWGLTPQEAIDLPNIVARGDTVRVESDRASEILLQTLKGYGFNVKESAGENSGLSIIMRKPDGSLEGGVDPRREGTNDAKGYGFIAPSDSGRKVFVHISDIENKRQPDIGNAVIFDIKKDEKGRVAAANVKIKGLPKLPSTILFSAIFLVLSSLVILIFGGQKLLIPIYFIMSFITYVIYWLDKKAAQNGQFRTPEKVLHMLALFCGWPGALMAQHQFRHKSKKQPFKTILWLTVVLNIVGLVCSFTPPGVELVQEIIKKIV